MPRGRVGGLRSAASRDIVEDVRETALPGKKQGLYQFRSKAASFILSLRRRRQSRGPDGEVISEAARSKMDTPLDWIRFRDNYFETPDPELAALIASKPGFGVGSEFWSLDEEKDAHDRAYEDELRRKLAERPDIAARVIRTSEAEDFAVPKV